MTQPDAQTLLSVTRRVVDRFSYEGRLFTALDVSNAVKQTLPSVRHREVSPLVRELFDRGGLGDDYTRSLIDVAPDGKRTKVQAFLYHLEGQDPGDYGSAQRSQLPIPPVSASPKDDSSLDPAVDQLDLGVGQDGRLRIPRQLLEKAGVDSESVQVALADGGPALALTPLPPGDIGTGIGVLMYVHPSFMHVPGRFLDAFPAGKAIRARADTANSRLLLEES